MDLESVQRETIITSLIEVTKVGFSVIGWMKRFPAATFYLTAVWTRQLRLAR